MIPVLWRKKKTWCDTSSAAVWSFLRVGVGLLGAILMRRA